ncbi:MAG: hypothetical protein ABIE36_03470 [Candidatus Diapherotrites archaeon]
MIEYKLVREDNSQITVNDFESIHGSVRNIFPNVPVEKSDMGGSIREAYKNNGHTILLYYREKNTKVFIPKEHEEEIKKNFGLQKDIKLGERKCL